MYYRRKGISLPHLRGKGSTDLHGADIDSSIICAAYPKMEPSPEDLGFLGSFGLLYAGFEVFYQDDYGDFGSYGGDNFMVKAGIVNDWNFAGSYGERAIHGTQQSDDTIYKSEDFTDDVHMERTGTYGDYGYISED